MIKAITFDLDGVYFPDGKANFLQALQKYGVSEEDARTVFLKSDEMNNQYKLGKMSDLEYWGWAAKTWQIDASAGELIELLIASYRVDAHVDEVVRTVRNNGYKTLICSNNFPARVTGLQERFSFLDNFDAAVFSYEVGAAKPSKEIFDALIEKSGVEANEIVYADDDETKLAGAVELGINAFVYEDFDKFIEQLRQLGVQI